MAVPETNHEASIGWRVWWMEDLSVMARAHTHADVEINVPLRGGPLRYLLLREWLATLAYRLRGWT
jgi:hypothetical protein